MTSTKSNFITIFTYIFKKLLGFYKNQLWVYSILLIVTGLLPQLDAFITGKLIDNILSRSSAVAGLSYSEQTAQIIPPVALVIFLFFLMRVLYDWQSYVFQSFNLRLQNFGDKLEFEALIRLPPHVYENSGFIALKSIVDYNIWKLGNTVFWTISIVGAVVTNLFVVVVFLAYSPIILMSALASLIFPSIIRLKFGKRVWGIWDSMTDQKIKYSMYRNPLYTDEATKFVETKVFGYGPYLLHKFTDINAKFLESLVTNERKRLIFTLFARVFEYACVGIGFWFIFASVMKGTISVGSLYFLITMYGALRSSTTFTLEQLTNIMADAPFMRSLYSFLTYESEYKIVNGTKAIENGAPKIEFKDVWFKYPGTDAWVLKGVSLQIDAKTDVAFVGKNGAGKTTLIKLILRIYDPTSGEILINGINIKELSIEDYYKQIGILAQEFHKFHFSAGENISIGDVTKVGDIDSRIVSAAKKAKADGFIDKYELKYDTYLSRELPGGITPSGGQMQRIAIARVFFRNPNLIILDEPTSAIDSLAEEQIFANIKEESTEKTVIIISHRFATVKKADYIYVIDDGVIKEHGTHGELYLNDGLYSKMYNAQHS